MYQAGNQGLTKEEDITAYVWRYGIRPAWSEDKNKSIRQKVADFLKMEPPRLEARADSKRAEQP
jgi:hypothetical protein